MRLFEIEAPSLYISTSKAQGIGKVVSMDSSCCPLLKHIEDRLEAKRPQDCVSRLTSIPLSTEPKAADFVYLVEPISWGRHHAAWLKKMHETDPSQTGVLDHCASGYWSGIECPEAKREPWEYRAASVKILRRIGRSASPGAS